MTPPASKKPDKAEDLIAVHRDDGDPTTPDVFVLSGAEGLSRDDIGTLIREVQQALAGLNSGMSTITSGLTEVLGAEGRHRVMERAMADNVEAWTEVARALSPGQFQLPPENVAALEQVRELLARGDYSQIDQIPLPYRSDNTAGVSK